jgi:hypothetical protein
MDELRASGTHETHRDRHTRALIGGGRLAARMTVLDDRGWTSADSAIWHRQPLATKTTTADGSTFTKPEFSDHFRDMTHRNAPLISRQRYTVYHMRPGRAAETQRCRGRSSPGLRGGRGAERVRRVAELMEVQ